MDRLNEDLDDSALMCMSLIQKRKASDNIHTRKLKQTKLDCAVSSSASSSSSSEKERWEDEPPNRLEESISGYFENNKKVNTCPLCLKSFESDSSYLAHMKQCAKKRDLTTQQLLSALKLQKEHMEQRRMLGLCTQVVPTKKATTVKKKVEKKDNYDLALGIALSKSLGKNPLKKETLNSVSVSSRKKPKISILRERTMEERQKIITVKLAVILLDDQDDNHVQERKKTIAPKNDQWIGLLNQDCHLWNMGENEVSSGWFVDEIKNFVEINPKEVQEEPSQKTPLESDKMDKEIARLDLPNEEEFLGNWRKMIDNRKLSDIVGKTKDRETFFLHSLVVIARCPEILEKDYESVFQKYTKSTVLIFLEYLYCGTLSGLLRTEVSNLLSLAVDLGYGSLVEVLNRLEMNEEEDEVISSSWTPNLEDVVEEKGDVTIVGEEDMFEGNLVDLTQSSRSSTVIDEDEENAEKSYWSFIQHEKEKEEREKTEEMDKIETSMKEREEMMRRISKELEEDLKTDLQMERIPEIRRESSDSATKDLDEDVKARLEDCIVISSDSESKAPAELDYEVPCFDPYDEFYGTQFSPVNYNLESQSLITGDVSFMGLPKGNDSIREDAQQKGREEPEYFSTPLTNRQTSRIDQESTGKKSTEKKRKRRSDLSSSRIIRKSLGLDHKLRMSGKKRKSKKESFIGGKDFAEVLTNSILSEFSNSPVVKSSTPVRRSSFVEMTPAGRLEFGESVTPSPNYSGMGEALLKDHLSKYGLKKNLAKSKAKKILRHIYEELHPLLNTKTGKIVKIISKDTPKGKKKTKTKTTQRRSGKVKQTTSGKKNKKRDSNSSKDSDQKSVGSLDRSTDYDSDRSEFEDLYEPLTQSVPNNPMDLPSAFLEFLEMNPEFHKKILMYEPVWIEEVQKKLKETFKKHFKLSDLMDYLDQKCITFRSEAQKRNNQKKNEKKKNSPRKRKNLSD